MSVSQTESEMGSGCGAVGRGVASDSRDLQIESSHWQFCSLSKVKKKILSCTNPNQFLEYGANPAYFYYFVLYTMQTQGSRMAGANGSIQA